MSDHNRCSRCLAEGGKPHPTLGFEVQLKKAMYKNEQARLCQRCYIRNSISVQEKVVKK